MSDDFTIEYKPLAELLQCLHPQNPKQHDISAIVTSYKEHGYVASGILDSRTNLFLAGHGRVEALAAMKRQKMSAPRGIRNGGDDWLVPVQVGYHSDNDVAALAYLAADNKITELGGWDEPALAELLQELANSDEIDISASGFDAEALDDLLRDLGMQDEPPQDPGAQIDKAAEFNKKWQVKLGQVWELGRHKVMCANSTDADNIDKITDGVKSDLCLTDPPYGIDVVKLGKGSTADSGGASPITMGGIRPRRKYPFGGVKNINRATVGGTGMVDATLYRPVIGDDKPFEPEYLLDIADNQIIFGGNYFASKLPDSRCWVVWDKDNTGNFADAELAWTSFKTSVRLYKFTWNGMVREGDRGIEGIKRVHPTQKPVGLFTMILNDYSEPGQTIIDPYLGSGTTLIACENSGRACIGLEISPEYCAVILQRWADLTEQSPVLISSCEDVQ